MGARVVRAQILLDRARFSPGEIDGVYGDDLGITVKGYQQNHGLEPTGTIDAKMWSLLNTDPGPLLLTYTITTADEKGPFQPIPPEDQDKAKLKWLGFETPAEGLGEKFHSSAKLLAELNPGRNMDTVGVQISAPNLRHITAGMALRVVGSKSKRTLIAYGAAGKVLAQYPASMGDTHDPLPIRKLEDHECCA
jgi:peptidoglycan hydrolase-like protein with peptidoglycan-binding domain